jgi:Dyp-type peroxidase family
LRDDRALADDPLRNNDFTYDPLRQDRCPFAAHTRKTNPREDLARLGGSEIRRILRRGIQFGPEVTPKEAAAKTSSKDLKLERGLLFVCYQSNIANGFEFIQQSKSKLLQFFNLHRLTQVGWANNPRFPPGKGTAKPPIATPGFDPLIGRAPTEDPCRNLVGHIPDPAFATDTLNLTANWVIPRGGEYFFSPSISALRNTLAQEKTDGAAIGAEL